MKDDQPGPFVVIITISGWDSCHAVRDQHRVELSRSRLRCGSPSEQRLLVLFGHPPEFGSEQTFQTLAEALAWANRDEGGFLLVIKEGP